MRRLIAFGVAVMVTLVSGQAAAISPGGVRGDEQTTIIYGPSTGYVGVDVPASTNLTAIDIYSWAGIFTGDPAQNLGGSFDIDTDHEIFKATFGSSFGSLSFGNVAQAGLAFFEADVKVDGSLAGGGDLGMLGWGHLNYVGSEPAAVLTPIPDLSVGADAQPIEAYVDLPFVFASLREKTNFNIHNTNSDLVTTSIDHDRTLDLAFAPNSFGRATITVQASTDTCGSFSFAEDSFDVVVLPSASAGDANLDGRFDQLDIVHVLQSAKYITDEPATWSEGDWNGDGVFDQLDIVAALATGNYMQG